MELVIQISQFLLSLSLLIVLHELGHFIPAKLFKTRVEKFYLFFDVKFALFKKKIGETEYGIGWLPLGGYVKISGMIDESMDKEQMAQPPKPWEFRSKPAWQRLIIMLGGVFVNFVLAYVIYVGLSYTYGDKYIENQSIKHGFSVQNPVLKKIGFKTGDKIVAIDGETIYKENEITKKLITAKKVTISRNNVYETINLPEDFLGQLSDSKNEYGLFEIRTPFVFEKVLDTSLNYQIDLKEGDVLKSINGLPAEFDDQFSKITDSLKNQTVTAVFLRDNDTLIRPLIIDTEGKLDILRKNTLPDFEKLGYFKINTQEYSFAESFGVGWQKFASTVKGYFKQLKLIFNPKTGAYKGVGGFKAILDIFPDFWSWQAFWSLTAFLSIMLGVLNLLPIPALDGGHVIFLLYEIITGKKPSEKFLERAQIVGFFILIALIVFANGNDIYRWITGK